MSNFINVMLHRTAHRVRDAEKVRNFLNLLLGVIGRTLIHGGRVVLGSESGIAVVMVAKIGGYSVRLETEPTTVLATSSNSELLVSR